MNSRFLENALFALRNIFRQRARAVANLLAIALGVAGLIVVGGFVQDIFVVIAHYISCGIMHASDKLCCIRNDDSFCG